MADNSSSAAAAEGPQVVGDASEAEASEALIIETLEEAESPKVKVNVNANVADADADADADAETPKGEAFQPGDHVIRWEMLPIAWPIQVHGIVLNVHEDHVVLVDFGLSAPPADKTKPSVMSSNPKKVEQALKNFKIGGKKPEKNRLNIHVISNPKDIAKWKKVNYDGGWFSEGKEKNGDASESSNDKQDASPTKAMRTKQWFSRVGTSFKEKTKPLATNIKEKAAPGIDNLKNKSRSSITLMKERASSIRQNLLVDKRNPSSRSFDSTEAATETHIPEEYNDDDGASGPDWLKSATSQESDTMVQPSASMTATSEGGNESTAAAADALNPSNSTISESSNTSDFSSCQMNPAMKDLLQKKSEENPPKTMNPAMAKILNKKAEEEAWEKKKKDSLARLPKADPPKLVLARTHYLLEHGEAVLPTYHAFSSNSECIAVFCKTGHWNTLQADVFLHSTAIGNAKTFTATTIGVAASVPLLAPVVGIAGLAAVGAPWLYLNKQKNKAVDSQQRLTDSFWAQAEPEVFVECIETWSKELLEMEGAITEKIENEETGADDDIPTITTLPDEDEDNTKQENNGDTEDEKKEESKPAPVVQSI